MNPRALPSQGLPQRLPKLHLRLYTGERTFDTKAAISQVHSLLGAHRGSYELEVLDSEEHRELAIEDEALLTPMLVRVSPGPILRLLMPQNNQETLRRKLMLEQVAQ
jgi:hypothetical protein